MVEVAALEGRALRGAVAGVEDLPSHAGRASAHPYHQEVAGVGRLREGASGHGLGLEEEHVVAQDAGCGPCCVEVDVVVDAVAAAAAVGEASVVPCSVACWADLVGSVDPAAYCSVA